MKINKIIIGMIGTIFVNVGFSQQTNNLQVSANVEKGCVVQGGAASFGDLTFTSTIFPEAIATVVLQCSKNTQVKINTDQGIHYGKKINAYQPHMMKRIGSNENLIYDQDRTSYLEYHVYLNSISNGATVTQPLDKMLYNKLYNSNHTYVRTNGVAHELVLKHVIQDLSFGKVFGDYSDTYRLELTY